MALGRRKGEQQDELFIMAEDLPKAPGHVFYRKLNAILREAGFDPWVENLCRPFYAETQGRPGIPPGTYFRMVLIGHSAARRNRVSLAQSLNRFNNEPNSGRNERI